MDFGLAAVGSVRGVSLLVLAAVLAASPVHADDFTFVSVDDDHIAWDDPANWLEGSVPGISDDATVASGLLRGAEVKDFRSVNSLVLDSGLNVYRSGTLLVTTHITANAGYFVYDGTILADIVNDTYIAGTGIVVGDLENKANGAVIVDGLSSGALGTWSGDVVSNAGFIVNDGGFWYGDIVGNNGMIINQKGGTWTGDVLSNTADIYSLNSIWEGDLDNAGSMELSGIVRGSITNSGTVAVNDPLSEVTEIVNTGIVRMNDDAADDTLNAQSWSGDGILVVDFDPRTFRTDRVVLSDALSGNTEVQFVLVGPAGGRTIGETQVVTAAGVNTGTLTAPDLPSDGVISYRLVPAGNGWALTTILSDAPAHVAAALGFVEARLDSAARVGLDRTTKTCGTGVWAQGLGSSAAAGATSADFSGLQLGYDLACLSLPGDATLGLGLTMGMANGRVTTDFGAGAPLWGSFAQGLLGLYGSLVDGAFRAVLQSGLTSTQYRLGDPQSGLDTAGLTSTSASISGTAGYDLALGGATITPELGLAVRSGSASSTDFADMGAIGLRSGPTASAHAGVTLSADLALDSALTLSPFASLALHGNLVAPTSADFTDSAGTRVALPLEGSAPYLALAFGADLVRAEIVDGAGTLEAGLRADFSIGPDRTDTALGGHARVAF